MIVAFSAQFFFGSSCAEARSTDTFDIRRRSRRGPLSALSRSSRRRSTASGFAPKAIIGPRAI